MAWRIWLLFISDILLQLFLLTISKETPIETYCNYGPYQSNYTSNSTFGRKIDTLHGFSFTSNFHNFSIDHEVNVIALCRGDIALDTCRSCLDETNRILRECCTNEKEAITWLDNCSLWYSDRAIFNTVNTFPNVSANNTNRAPDANQFNKAVRTLLDWLRERAALGSSVMKFATGNMSVTNDLTIYGLVQCTPDLTAEQCSDCLNGAAEFLPHCCDGKIGGRELRPSCNVRYETHLFYGVTAADAQYNAPSGDNELSPPPPSTAGNGDSKTLIIIIATVIPTIIFAIVVCIFIFRRRNRKQRTLEDKSDALVEMSSAKSLQYDFDTIKVATHHFSDINKLGRGGFGAVYKGTLRDGREIAVKRLDENSKQGEKQFKAEVSVLAKLQHKNLVKLLGYSQKGTERLLIYEFVPNGSLDNFIFDQEKRKNLGADKLYNIIIGVARGILFLHEDSCLRIIHRDIKASNILLDVDMKPKIADFGLAKLFKQEKTYVTTSFGGTNGYIAPEYAERNRLSFKVDVFSFGVLVLEIVSGQKNTVQNGENVEYLPSIAWKNWRDKRASDLIDPILLRQGAGSIHNITRCFHIALLCVQKNTADRPTMDLVKQMLRSDPLTLPVPSEPPIVDNTSAARKDTKTRSSTSNCRQYISCSEDTKTRSSQNNHSITEHTSSS